MKINMISETINEKKGKVISGNGVHSAFQDVLNSLKNVDGIDVEVNSEKDLDIIHSHTIGPRYMKSSKNKKYKTLVSAHVIAESMVDSIILSKYWLWIFKIWLKKAYNRASVVLAVSPTVKKELEKMNLKSRVLFLPNSINREKFKKNRDKKFLSKFNVKETDFVAGAIGQLQTRKGIKEFVETAKKLPDIKFFWCGHRPFGKATAGYLETEKIIKKAPKNVVFTGFIERENISKFLNSCDVFFFPSHQENHPVSVIEAGSCKLPIILKDIEEYKDIFFDWYLKGKTIDDYVKVIKELKENKELYEKYEEYSEKIGNEYDVKRITKLLVTEYKKLYDNYKK